MIINQINSGNEKRKYNIFLSILRHYLAFIVINAHFLRTHPLMNKYILRFIRKWLSITLKDK